MLLITNIVTSHIRTNPLKQICGSKYFATIVMDGRKNTKAGRFFFVCLFCLVVYFGFFFNLGVFSTSFSQKN